MKTAQEMLDRLEGLARRIADARVPIGNLILEARAMVAELPPPVDPDLIEAREMAAVRYSQRGETQLALVARPYRSGLNDEHWDVQTALAGIKRGRELERQGK